MKKLLVLSALFLAIPFSMFAQDDDMYFVPKKKSAVKAATDTYYVGSKRDVDEYNHRGKYRKSARSMGTDTISFDGRVGIYPDSVYTDTQFADRFMNREREYDDNNDYCYSRQLDRWYGAYDPWFYGPGYYGSRFYWRSPYFYSTYYGFYNPWYDPWYYGYGWSSPWYSGYYGWYDPWYGYGLHGYYGWGYGYPYYYYGGYGSGSSYFNDYGIAGTSGHGRVTSPGFDGSRSTSGHGSFGGARRNYSTAIASGSRNSVGSSTRAFGGSRNSGSFGGSRNSGTFGGSRSSGTFGGSRVSQSPAPRTMTRSSSEPIRSYTPSRSSSTNSSYSSGSFGGSRSFGGGSFGGSRSSGGGSFGGSRSSGGGSFGGSRR